MSAHRLPLARQAKARNAASGGSRRARCRTVMGELLVGSVVPRVWRGAPTGRTPEATERGCQAVRKSQRLVEELRAGPAGVTAALVEAARGGVADPDLQLQAHTPALAQGCLCGGEQLPADALRPRVRQHEEFVDLGHETAVLEAQHVHQCQVTAQPGFAFGDQDLTEGAVA